MSRTRQKKIVILQIMIHVFKGDQCGSISRANMTRRHVLNKREKSHQDQQYLVNVLEGFVFIGIDC